MKAGSSPHGDIFYFHQTGHLPSQWQLPSLSAPHALRCQTSIYLPTHYQINVFLQYFAIWKSWHSYQTYCEVKCAEEMTVTWHLDSINIGFFETITDGQDVRHLVRGHILTFPSVGSMKLQRYINLQVCACEESKTYSCLSNKYKFASLIQKSLVNNMQVCTLSVAGLLENCI